MTGPGRSSAMPDVPTFAEQGYKGFELPIWVAAYAPAGTPKPIVDRLQKEIAAVIRLPDVLPKLIDQGQTPLGNTPEEFAAAFARDAPKWIEFIKASGAKPVDDRPTLASSLPPRGRGRAWAGPTPGMIDQGTAYGLAPATHDKELTEVGAGTPMGELLRRYWHPVGLAADAGATPRQVRVLGEDLILFRDGQGRPGLVHPRCAHRGASLYYGRVEADGIRCCYHGWMFAFDGRCLDQPCEPDGGTLRDNVRQPWYPLEERYGLVFAYLGPPEKKPLLPRIDVLEQLGEGEFARGRRHQPRRRRPADHSRATGCSTGRTSSTACTCRSCTASSRATSSCRRWRRCPRSTWETTERGVRVIELSQARRRPAPAPRHRGGDADASRRAEPAPRQLRPGRVDRLGAADRRPHFRIYVAGRVKQPGDIGRMRSKMNGKFWWELSEAEHRDFPGDYEAQVSQGRDHGAFGGAPAHQRPRRRAAAPLPARAARGRWRTATTRAGVARGPAADAMQRFANCGNFLAHEGPAADAADAGGAVHRGDLGARARARAGRVPLGPADAELADVDIALGWRCRPAWRRACRASAGSARSPAGVEKLLAPDLAPHVLVSRIVDPEQAAGIAQFVVTMALRHARELERYEAQQRERAWSRKPLPMARHRVARARHRRDGRRDRRLARALSACRHAAGTGARRSCRRRCSRASDIVVCALPLTDGPKASSTRGFRGDAARRLRHQRRARRARRRARPDRRGALGPSARRSPRRAAKRAAAAPTIRSGRCPASRSRRTSPRSRRPR